MPGRREEAAESSRTTLAPAVGAGYLGCQAYALYDLGLPARHPGRTHGAVYRHRQSAELGARCGSPAMEAGNPASRTAAQPAGTASRTPWNAASAPRRRPPGSAGAPPDSAPGGSSPPP
ncbi:hypothetical protein ABZ766_15655 [Streptomyces sp. NPDC006670]|uniref:hypothetical protein n=1 Tax=Streptomyces sp. NPDC006670 TaxID=3154476 RepID=UPI0033D803EC